MHLFIKKILVLGGAAACFLPLQSFAQDTSRNKEISERFAKCDTNHDGKLTLDEAKGCMPRIYDHFGTIDAQNKGYVTVAEIETVANR